MATRFLTETPRVALVLSFAFKSNRDKLTGIFQYVQLHNPWNIQIVDRKIDGPTIAKIRAWRPSGIIVGKMFEAIDRVLTLKAPTVVMDSNRDGSRKPPKNIRYITCSSEAIAHAGADYLKKKGFRHFAYVCDKQGSDWAFDRSYFFKSRLEQSLQTFSLFTPKHKPKYTGGKDWGAEQNRLATWLASLPKQTAVFAANDSQGREILELCQIANIQVPSDLAILGCDNDEMLCENTTPTLSSIEPDFETCGYKSAQLLEQLMFKGSASSGTLFYGARRIVERESTQLRSFALDARVRKGLDFIRLNASRAIGVSDIARHMGVSRRSAEWLFKNQLRNSIIKEIQISRIEKMKRLLLDTNRPITMLYSLCGYQSEAHAKRLFKSLVGMPMSEFRNRHKPVLPRQRLAGAASRSRRRSAASLT